MGRRSVPGGSDPVAWARRAPARLVRGGILRGVLGPVMRYYGRPEVFGTEHLEGLEPPIIFASNHSSHADTPAILLALPRRLRSRTLVAAAADHFYQRKLTGAAVSLAIGAIPLERQRPGAESLQALRAILEQGWNILAFPEGSRSRDGRLYRGKTGLARIALDGGLPVVPIGVRGSMEVMHSDRRWPRRGHIEVRFGSPLRFDRYHDQPTDRFILRSVTDEIMYEIMLLSGQEYVDAYAHKPKPGGETAAPAGAEPAGERADRPLQAGSDVPTRSHGA